MKSKNITLRKLINAVNDSIPIDAQQVRRVAALCGVHSLFPPVPYKEILYFLFNRTIDWGKIVELVTREHFISGLPGVSAGVSSSPRKIDRALSYLEERKLINTIRFKSGDRTMGVGYYLNFGTLLGYYSVLERGTLPEIRLSGIYKIERLYKPYMKMESIAIDCNSTVEGVMKTMKDALKEAKSKTEVAREKKVEKLKARSGDKKSITRAIDDLCVMYNAPKQIWSAKTKGMATNFVRTDHDGDVSKAKKEIEAAISEWSSIRSRVLDLTHKRVFIPRDPSFEDLYRLRKEFRDVMRTRTKVETNKQLKKGETKIEEKDTQFETQEEKKRRILEEQDKQFSEDYDYEEK